MSIPEATLEQQKHIDEVLALIPDLAPTCNKAMHVILTSYKDEKLQSAMLGYLTVVLGSYLFPTAREPDPATRTAIVNMFIQDIRHVTMTVADLCNEGKLPFSTEQDASI